MEVPSLKSVLNYEKKDHDFYLNIERMSTPVKNYRLRIIIEFNIF